MKKSPMEMDYNELDALLDSMLKSKNLPSIIEYSGNQINYHKKRRLWLLVIAAFRITRAHLFYIRYIKKKIHPLKKTVSIYDALKKTGCLKNLRTYFYLSKAGLTDFSTHVGGKFDDELFANFAIATTVYDASFDIPLCRKYLKFFDGFIMKDKHIHV